MARFLIGTRRQTFLAIAARVVPEMAALDEGAQGEALALVERQIASRPEAVRRDLARFLALIRWTPALRYGRPFDRLPSDRQDAVLRWLQDAPSTKVRAGFWGLKTLAFLGYYDRPEAGEAVHYRPSRDGNAFLHAR